LGAVGVWSGVSHGEETWLGVLVLEVLIWELLTVDGLATSTVATGEVTTLKHELWDDTVELAALVAESLLTSAESTEVLSGTWYVLVVKVEVYSASERLHTGVCLSLVIGGFVRVLDIEVDLDNHVCG